MTDMRNLLLIDKKLTKAEAFQKASLSADVTV